jgi:hypothetical protein
MSAARIGAAVAGGLLLAAVPFLHYASSAARSRRMPITSRATAQLAWSATITSS